MDTDTAKTPIHLWIVGVLPLLWNGFGCFDYFMTRTHGAAYIETMMPDVDANAYMAYINAFPIWASIGWGLGVWAGLAGSILLLVRHRWAVPALLTVAGRRDRRARLPTRKSRPASRGMNHGDQRRSCPIVIIAVTSSVFLYARAMRIKGVLR